MRAEPSDERGQADAAEQKVVDRYDRITGRRDWERRRGCRSQTHPPSLRGQVAKPAPITSTTIPPFRGSSSRYSPSLSGQDHTFMGQLHSSSPPLAATGQPQVHQARFTVLARQAARLAAVGISSLALWRLISALLRRGN